MRDLNNKSINREAQGRSREAWSERSVYQTDEPMNKNVIGGADGGRAGPGSQSPSGQTRYVNDAVVPIRQAQGMVSLSNPCRDSVSTYPGRPPAVA